MSSSSLQEHVHACTHSIVKKVIFKNSERAEDNILITCSIQEWIQSFLCFLSPPSTHFYFPKTALVKIMPMPLLFLKSSQQCPTIFLKMSAPGLRHCKPVPLTSLAAVPLSVTSDGSVSLASPGIRSHSFQSMVSLTNFYESMLFCLFCSTKNQSRAVCAPCLQRHLHPVTQVNHLYLQNLPRPLIAVSTMSTLILVSTSLSGAITRLRTCPSAIHLLNFISVSQLLSYLFKNGYLLLYC